MGKHNRKNVMRACFTVLEKLCNRVDREALWQMLRMYDVDGKIFIV